MDRLLRLPAHGKLLVNTDLHGNLGDFLRLEEIFEQLRAEEPRVSWVILGDIVHGPDSISRVRLPEYYDYEDRSWEIARRIIELRERYPSDVHYVLGNHDYAHIGGPTTRKFHDDEVEHLEATLSPDQIESLGELFTTAYLFVATPCGPVLSHGAPSNTLRDVVDLSDMRLPPPCDDDYQRDLVLSFMNFYGQSAEVCELFLDTVRGGTGLPATFVIHGHDRDRDGYFTEAGNQVCPVVFGAMREHKRYIVLDLEHEIYATPDALDEGHEIRRLYPI
jgi:hypothetical protein